MSQLRVRRGLVALLLTAAGLAVATPLVAPAQAANPNPVTVRMVGNVMKVQGTTVRDVITIGCCDSGAVTVSSSTGPVSAGIGCTPNGGSTVNCSGVTSITGNLGSDNDGIQNNTNIPMGVNGASGDDVLVGGVVNDTLNGGSGADVADGRGGRDTCSAETVLNCEEVTP